MLRIQAVLCEVGMGLIVSIRTQAIYLSVVSIEICWAIYINFLILLYI